MRKTIGRDLPNGDYIEIEAEERDGSGTLSAGFAITCSVWERNNTWPARTCAAKGRDISSGGADHDLILSVAPELAPIVTAHLSDTDGTPMHAEANGWYFYSGASAAYERRMIAEGRDYGYSRNLETSRPRPRRSCAEHPAGRPAHGPGPRRLRRLRGVPRRALARAGRGRTHGARQHDRRRRRGGQAMNAAIETATTPVQTT